MALVNFINPTRVVGDMSVSSRSTGNRRFVSAEDGSIFDGWGTDDWIIFVQSGYRLRDDSNTDHTMTDQWLLGFGRDRSSSSDNCIRIRQRSSGLFNAYIRYNGALVSLEVTISGASRLGGNNYVFLKKEGDEFTLGVLDCLETGQDSAYISNTDSASTATTFNMDTMMSTTGALVIGNQNDTNTGGSIYHVGAFVIARKPSSSSWADFGLDTDDECTRAAYDPHTALVSQLNNFEELITFDMVNSSGTRTKYRGFTHLATDDKLKCPHTSKELTQLVVGSSTTQLFTRGIYEPLTVMHEHKNNRNSDVAEIIDDTIMVKAAVYAGPGADFYSAITRFNLDGEPIAPALMIRFQVVYLDGGDENTLVVRNAEMPSNNNIGENHYTSTIAYDAVNSRICVFTTQHSDRRVIDTDIYYATGYMYDIRETGLPSHTYLPYGDIPESTRRSTSYSQIVAHTDGNIYGQTRRSSTVGGVWTLFRFDKDRAFTVIDVTEPASTGSGTKTASGPTSCLIYLKGDKFLSVATSRYNGSEGYYGNPSIILDVGAFDNDQAGIFKARTGEDVRSDVGTLEWQDADFYVVPPNTETRASPRYQLDQLKDSGTSLNTSELTHSQRISERGIWSFTDLDGTVYVCYLARTEIDFDRSLYPNSLLLDTLKLHVFTFNETENKLDLFRTHDLTSLLATELPEANVNADIAATEDDVSTVLAFHVGGKSVILACSTQAGNDWTSYTFGGARWQFHAAAYRLISIKDVLAETIETKTLSTDAIPASDFNDAHHIGMRYVYPRSNYAIIYSEVSGNPASFNTISTASNAAATTRLVNLAPSGEGWDPELVYGIVLTENIVAGTPFAYATKANIALNVDQTYGDYDKVVVENGTLLIRDASPKNKYEVKVNNRIYNIYAADVIDGYFNVESNDNKASSVVFTSIGSTQSLQRNADTRDTSRLTNRFSL